MALPCPPTGNPPDRPYEPPFLSYNRHIQEARTCIVALADMTREALENLTDPAACQAVKYIAVFEMSVLSWRNDRG